MRIKSNYYYFCNPKSNDDFINKVYELNFDLNKLVEKELKNYGVNNNETNSSVESREEDRQEELIKA